MDRLAQDARVGEDNHGGEQAVERLLLEFRVVIAISEWSMIAIKSHPSVHRGDGKVER